MCVGAIVACYRYMQPQIELSPEEVFEQAFPGGEEQPVDQIRNYLRTRRGINAVHLNFWLFVGDQNQNGCISKEEFVRVLKVGSYSRFDSWEADLRLMAFRVMDTDHDGVVDREELLVGLTKLLKLLGVHENAHTAVAGLLPEESDVLSDQEWVRSPLARRLISRQRIQPLLIQ